MSLPTDQKNRRLTTLRKDARKTRTRIINKIKLILRRHNLQWHMPTKTFPTLLAIAWLKKLVLPAIDRLEMDHLLADLKHAEQRFQELEQVIAERCGHSEEVRLLETMPGVGRFNAVALSCRVGCVERFPRANSLANYWGLTPGCRNSGENNQWLGSITKAGGSMARCSKQFEIPPVWANSNFPVDVVTRATRCSQSTTRRGVWSGPYGEEFALDTSASVTKRQSLSRTT